MPTHDRRRFLARLIGGAAATAFTPRLLDASRRTLDWRDRLGLSAAAADDEAYWQIVKEQFPLRDGLILMNAANLCPSPYPVIETVEQLTRDIDADASFQNRAKFDALRENGRRAIAAYLGADADEIAITRNTSESNNTVVNGVTLEPGDEVVLWEQNHPTNNISWDVKAQRDGFSVKRVSTPEAPTSAAELIAPFDAAMTPRTRVLAFSHVSNVSGIALPAADLCRMARERGVLTLVDGAQAFGVLRLDLHALGCDFYTGSSHKWFVGPKEAGILYVRGDRVEGLRASDVGVGWEQALEHGAQKFDNLGQRDDAAVAAMATAVRFHETIGVDRIERRGRALIAALRERLRDAVPAMRFHPDVDPEFSAAVLIFIPPVDDPRALYDALYERHHIAGAPRGAGIRLSPHLYNTMEEVERVAGAVKKLVA